jgi:uncharacterized protein YcbX
VHRLRSKFDPATNRLTLRVEGTGDAWTFHVESGRCELADWLSDYLKMQVTVIENADGGFPDDTQAPGPTVISRATLAEVATWYPGLTVEEVRSRFRANLEIDGVEAFWEDRLMAEGLGVVRFRIGDAELLGTNPCARCVVPSRHPVSGEPIREFAKTFARRREASLAAWAPRDRFDHFYRLSVNTRRASARPCVVRVGDEVQIIGVE